jgi:hypothetical protein
MDVGSIALSSMPRTYDDILGQKATLKSDLAQMIARLIEANDQDGSGALSAAELGISEETSASPTPTGTTSSTPRYFSRAWNTFARRSEHRL